jgi:hypothetical protein
MLDAVQGRWDTSIRGTISKGCFVQEAQHPRIFGRGHIGGGHINPASVKVYRVVFGDISSVVLCCEISSLTLGVGTHWSGIIRPWDIHIIHWMFIPRYESSKRRVVQGTYHTWDASSKIKRSGTHPSGTVVFGDISSVVLCCEISSLTLGVGSYWSGIIRPWDI